ncbi:MAG: hypothetical protein R2838_12710 [Caldilineaceae bacterium]
MVERLTATASTIYSGSPVVTHFQFYNELDRSPVPDDRGGGAMHRRPTPTC